MNADELAEHETIDVDYRVQVTYTVPLEVIVDVRGGTVDRVVVMDENITVDPEERARKEGFLHPVPGGLAKRAIGIAEARPWPVWEHGF